MDTNRISNNGKKNFSVAFLMSNDTNDTNQSKNTEFDKHKLKHSRKRHEHLKNSDLKAGNYEEEFSNSSSDSLNLAKKKKKIDTDENNYSQKNIINKLEIQNSKFFDFDNCLIKMQSKNDRENDNDNESYNNYEDDEEEEDDDDDEGYELEDDFNNTDSEALKSKIKTFLKLKKKKN